MRLLYFYIFLVLVQLPLAAHDNPPKLAVIIVIDQFSRDYLHKLRPHLTGGLKFLSENGVKYANAFYDHCRPSTAVGHTVLSTGTVGNLHGIVNNSWFNRAGHLVNSDDDSPERAAVFSPTGLYNFGKSARNIMVDGLSDQAVLHSYDWAPKTVWAFSLKSRAAIAMANKLGKAVWFDFRTGNFTSSKAYFDNLPDWLKQFNKQQAKNLKNISWPLFYPRDSDAYKFPDINNYRYSATDSLFEKNVNELSNQQCATLFAKTPKANKLLLDLAQECIDRTMHKNPQGQLIIWLGLSGLDIVAHEYGPYSKEAIDFVYHLDHQLQNFIRHVYKKVDPKDALFVLTADHGGHPIVEMLKDTGFTLAKRINPLIIRQEINNTIEDKYGIPDIITHSEVPAFYLNARIAPRLHPRLKTTISHDIKKIIARQHGIRDVWTSKELANQIFDKYDVNVYLKRQLYPGRSGDFIYAVNPYVHVDRRPVGTGHLSPYAYDTQVPLIFYQNSRFGHKSIAQNVWMPQVAPTLAHILDIPRPSASNSNVLPGLGF